MEAPRRVVKVVVAMGIRVMAEAAAAVAVVTALPAAIDVAVEKEYCHQLPLSESLLHSVHSNVSSIHDFAKPRLRVVGLSEKARQWKNERHNKKQSNTNTHTHIPSLSWLGKSGRIQLI